MLSLVHLSLSEESSTEILESDISYWKDPYGKDVLWIYGYVMDEDLNVIKEHIRKERERMKRDQELFKEQLEREQSKKSLKEMKEKIPTDTVVIQKKLLLF